MKKRVLAILLILAAIAAFCFAGCGSTTTVSTKSMKTKEKYVYTSSTILSGGETSYLIFNSNGTGEYGYYFYYSSSYPYALEISDYTIKFKYTYADKDKETVVAFYDSAEYGDSDTVKENLNNWHRTYSVSENVILGDGNRVFVRESYLNNELKNYGN